jgi:phosphoribosylformylglycinamidine (FGAM) synthase PurS component
MSRSNDCGRIRAANRHEHRVNRPSGENHTEAAIPTLGSGEVPRLRVGQVIELALDKAFPYSDCANEVC